MGDISLVTVVFMLPLAGMILMMIFARGDQQYRWGALLTSLITFGVSLLLLRRFDTAVSGLQMVQNDGWISGSGFSIRYYVGIDGISIWLVLLSTFIMPLAILFSFNSIKDRQPLYYALMMLMEWAMIGVFVAQDLFLFYVFWEVTLVPMYFLIGIWGAEDRIYAAIKFFLYTMAGSLLMLLAILWLGNKAGTFALPDILTQIRSGELTFSTSTGRWLFLAFGIAFAIKVPMWPLHSWLPDAHVQAPTAGSVILAGVLLKMGTYGFIRFNLPLFPEASETFAPYVCVLAVIGIIYGAWVSYGQKDMKKLVAYSSISHLGFRDARHFRAEPGGYPGRYFADGESRHQHGRLVFAGRCAVRTPPHQADERVRRYLESHAALQRYRAGGGVVEHGPTGAERLRR